jgi:hypothetical protein
VSRVKPGGGGIRKFKDETPDQGFWTIGFAEPNCSFPVPSCFVDDAELLKKGTAKSIPITMTLAIVTYKRDPLENVGAKGESVIIMGLLED